jgi:uncharacterized protein YcbK (DUF882 family)
MAAPTETTPAAVRHLADVARARLSRRGFLAAAAWGFAAALAPGVARAVPAPAEGVRRLSLHNLHTDERFDAVYFEGGAYVPGALDAIDLVLRDHRTGETCRMAPGVLDLLHAVTERVRSAGPVHIVSGFRSVSTNALLHANDPAHVAEGSLHLTGQAIDLCFEDRPLRRVRDAALALGAGGVGYYPRTGFVHIDIGRPRVW